LLDLIYEVKFGVLSLIPVKTYSLLDHPVVGDVISKLRGAGYSVETVSALRIASRYRTAKYFLDEITKIPDGTALIIDGLFLYGFGDKHRKNIEKLIAGRNVRVFLLTAIPLTLLRKYATSINKIDVIYSEYSNSERDVAIKLEQYHGRGAKVSDEMVNIVLDHIDETTKFIIIMAGRRKISEDLGERIRTRLNAFKLIKAFTPDFATPEGTNVVVTGVMYPVKVLHKTNLLVLTKERPKKISVLEVLYRAHRFGVRTISLYQVFDEEKSKKASSSKQVEKRKSSSLEEYRSYGRSVAIIRLDDVNVIDEMRLGRPVLYIPSFVLVDENGMMRRLNEINPKKLLLSVLKLPSLHIEETDDVYALIERLSNNQTLQAYAYYALRNTKYAGKVVVLPDTEITIQESIKLLRDLFFEEPKLFNDSKFIGVLNSLIAISISEDPNTVMRSSTVQNYMLTQLRLHANTFTKNIEEIENGIREQLGLVYPILRQLIADQLSAFVNATVRNTEKIESSIREHLKKTYLIVRRLINDTIKRTDEISLSKPVGFRRQLQELQRIEVVSLDNKVLVPGHENKTIQSSLLYKVIKVGNIVEVNGRLYRVVGARPRWEGIVTKRTEVYIVQDHS